MVFASNSRDGLIRDSTGGFDDEGDDVKIYNPGQMTVKVFRRAAGGESIVLTDATAPANRATLKDLPVQPPSSPARFTFPPSTPKPQADRPAADRPLMSDDDRIAAIVAKALDKDPTPRGTAEARRFAKL